MIWGNISRSVNGENILGGVAYKNKEELRIIASDPLLVDVLRNFDESLLEQNQQFRSYFVCFEGEG